MDSLKDIVEIRVSNDKDKNHWKKKADNLLNGLEYLNSEDLVKEQLNKLNSVGINSVKAAITLNENFSNQVIKIVDEELKETLNDINQLSKTFKLLTEILHSKKSIFSKKEPLHLFFEKFSSEKENINLLIQSVNVKKIKLDTSIKKLKEMLVEIENCFFLLERDVLLLKYIDENIKKINKPMAISIYEKLRYDLLEKRNDLMTQQQIVFQKHVAFKILNKSTESCVRNVKIISEVTYNVINNTLETQKIIEISNIGNNSDGLLSYDMLKNSFQKVHEEISKVSEKPFS